MNKYYISQDIPENSDESDLGTVMISYCSDDDEHFNKISVHGNNRLELAIQICIALNKGK